MSISESPSQDERRRYRRHNVHLPLRYQVRGDIGYADTLTKDIGGGGIRFITDEFLKRSAEIIFEFTVMENSEPIKGRAKIAWINKIPHNDMYCIGVEFIDIARDKRQTIIQCIDTLSKPCPAKQPS